MNHWTITIACDELDTRNNPVKVVEFVIMGWPAPLAAIG